MEVNIDKTKVIKFSGNGQCCKTFFFIERKGQKMLFYYKLQIFKISIFKNLWYLVKRYGQFGQRGLKALFPLKRYICTGSIKVRLGMNIFDQFML